MTYVTLGASGLWLETRTGADGTAKLKVFSFFDRNPWLHGQQIYFQAFSSAMKQFPGGLCTAPRIISLYPLSLATDVTLGQEAIGWEPGQELVAPPH